MKQFLTNCAASCQVCRPCADIAKVGDGFCDAGNNNPKCTQTRGDNSETSAYDGGDCCNILETPFFDFHSDNSVRYEGCVKTATAYDKKFCKCLDPAAGVRRNDCAGAFSPFSICSVTCEVGVQTKTFTVLSPAQQGGHACEDQDQVVKTQACGRATKKCPTTTTKTTTTTTTQVPVSVPGGTSPPTMNPNQKTSVVSGGLTTPTTVDGAATITTMIMNIVCVTLVYFFPPFFVWSRD